LPNHGNLSAIIETGDFSLPGIASIMPAALLQLVTGKPYIICSISLGTNIVAEMLTGAIEPKGLVLAGPCIVGEGFELDKMMLPGADLYAVFAENVPEEAVLQYASAVSLSGYQEDQDCFLKDLYSVQGLFRSSLFATIAAGNYSDQVAIIQQVKYPVCIVFGEDERVVNTHYLDAARIKLWNNTIYKIPSASHLVNIDVPGKFNKLIAAYAKNMFSNNAL
jgi:pimeloyl-ACP methyl ester carboxylesterase